MTALGSLLGASNGAAIRLGFYAALRRVECFYRSQPRIGEAVDPAHEALRFGQDPTLAFRAGAFSSVFDGDAERPARLATSFFGVFGANGPLPTHLTHYADERRRHHADATLIGFLDIFQHRLVSLFFRAWANSQPTVQHDRPESDRFARYLGALIGQGTRANAVPSSQLDETGLYSATHFVGQTRHAEGLTKVLRACFGVPVELEEFFGQWLQIPDQCCWRVAPSGPLTAAPLGVLGESSRVGKEVWDRQAKFRIVLGPLTGAAYERFLPGGSQLTKLIELVTRYVGPALAWDVRLVLCEPDRRPAVLGTVGLVGRTAHLGGAEAGSGSFEDLVLDPLEHAALSNTGACA
ncbi:MAG: hypothetical protein RL701_4823 [Pseudomonadota bacterium]|jgi:type VI secretion system protein ImpH